MKFSLAEMVKYPSSEAESQAHCAARLPRLIARNKLSTLDLVSPSVSEDYNSTYLRGLLMGII